VLAASIISALMMEAANTSEPEGSLLFSQEPGVESYPDPVESSAHPRTPFVKYES
jgi:hypothetical protein